MGTSVKLRWQIVLNVLLELSSSLSYWWWLALVMVARNWRYAEQGGSLGGGGEGELGCSQPRKCQ
jgi:hypothetical protein